MSIYTKQINGINYKINVEDVLYFQSESLWKAIQNVFVDDLRDGYKFEVGFSLYILQEKQNKKEYEVIVPDYTTSPFVETTDDLTLAFLIQMEQMKILQEHKILGEPIRFDDEIIVAKDVLMKSTICLQRFKNLHGSGWCVNEIKSDDESKFISVEATEYEMIYAYQLLSMRPSLLNVLLLPYDYLAVFDGDDCIEILNEKNESIIFNDNSN